MRLDNGVDEHPSVALYRHRFGGSNLAVVDSGDLPSGVAEGARLDRRPDHRLGAFVLAAINEFVDSLPLAVALENLLLAVAVGIFVWLR